MIDGEIRVDSQRLEEILKKRSLTLGMLAEMMEMHYNGVLRIKVMGTTNLGTLEKMCNALECHPFDLLVAKGYPQPFSLAPASL
jgi:DNA-binding Xre family transcriptional regulator